MAILNHRGFSLLNQSLDKNVVGVDNTLSLTSMFGVGSNLSEVATNMKYEEPKFSKEELSF